MNVFDGRLDCLNDEASSALQGKALTAAVRQVHADFAAAFAALQKVDYDVTDGTEARWVADHGRFQVALRDLERRLSHVVVVVCIGTEPTCFIVNILTSTSSSDTYWV